MSATASPRHRHSRSVGDFFAPADVPQIPPLNFSVKPNNPSTTNNSAPSPSKPSPRGHKKSPSLLDVFLGKAKAGKKKNSNFTISTDVDYAETDGEASQNRSVEEGVLRPSVNGRAQPAPGEIDEMAELRIAVSQMSIMSETTEDKENEPEIVVRPIRRDRGAMNLNKELPPIRTDVDVPRPLAREINLYTPRGYSQADQRNWDGVMVPGLRSPNPRPNSVYTGGERKSSWGSFISLSRRNSVIDNGEGASNESEKSGGLLSRMPSFSSTSGKRVHPAVLEKHVPPANSLNMEFNNLLSTFGLPENIKSGASMMKPNVKATLLRSSKVMSQAPLPPPSRDSMAPPPFGHSRSQMARNQASKEKKKRPLSALGAAIFRSGENRARGKTVTGAGMPSGKNMGARPKSSLSEKGLGKASTTNIATPVTPTALGPIHANAPEDFTKYLAKRKYKDVESEWLRRLKRMLRNERLAWVEAFVELRGLDHVIHLIKDVAELEYRDLQSDAVLKELIYCLKALYTAPMMDEVFHLKRSEIFPLILSIMMDQERKKTPFEYETREAAVGLIFTYLMQAPLEEQSARARYVMGLFEKPQAESRGPEWVQAISAPLLYVDWVGEFNRMTFETGWMWYHPGNKISVREVDPTLPFNVAHFPPPRQFLKIEGANHGCAEMAATNYAALHIDIMNAIIAYLPTREERNEFRSQLRRCNMEKIMGEILRQAGKGEEYAHHANLHSAMTTYVTAAKADEWESWKYIRTGRWPEDEKYAEKGKTMKKIERMYGLQHELPDVGIKDTVVERKRMSIMQEGPSNAFQVDDKGSVTLEWEF
ncbi:hypothetical protein ABW19_dt0210383 [Dactylella cylindrospora]|nr:hypothetical protein ABW19_dt0210383 [Dactylella cylindrospora]